MEKFRVTFDLMAPTEEDAIRLVEQMAQKASEIPGSYDTFSLENASTGDGVVSGGRWDSLPKAERD